MLQWMKYLLTQKLVKSMKHFAKSVQSFQFPKILFFPFRIFDLHKSTELYLIIHPQIKSWLKLMKASLASYSFIKLKLIVYNISVLSIQRTKYLGRLVYFVLQGDYWLFFSPLQTGPFIWKSPPVSTFHPQLWLMAEIVTDYTGSKSHVTDLLGTSLLIILFFFFIFATYCTHVYIFCRFDLLWVGFDM